VLGIISGYFKRIEWLLLPIVTFLRTVPTISITLILLIWFGKELGPIMIMGIVVFPILYELILGAMKQIDQDLLDVCLLFGTTKFEKFKALYYPQLLKTLSSGIQATIGLSFKVMVMAEVMAQSSTGIGQMLNYEKTYLNMGAVFAWTIILIVLVMIFEVISSFLIDALIRHLET
ncbi:MAG: ABC transporter permease subunit, partial [Turicibacter sp.]|nr:ABC transporter permease subunit [Turicibacter sp.]